MTTTTSDNTTSKTETLKNKISEMTAEEKATNISILNYIKTIASSVNTDISKWNILKIFGKEEGSFNLISDKKEINKRFFEQYNKIKEESKEAKKESSKEDTQEAQDTILNNPVVMEAIVQNAKRSRSALITHYKNNAEYSLAEMQRLLNSANIKQNEYLSSMQKCKELENVQDDVSAYKKCFEKVQDLIKEKLWVNPVFEASTKCLYLNTNANIMLHEVNKAANLDLHVDLGQLAVKIDFTNGFKFTVIPYKNNIELNGYYHPHIQHGSICWGEAQTMATKHIANLDLDKALRLLHALLNSYNPGSPYVRLAELKLNGKKYGRTPEDLKHPDKRRKSSSDKEETTTAVEAR